MSPVAIAAHGHAALPVAAFRTHHRDAHGTADTAGSSSVGKPGQLPVGAGSGLIASAVQSLQQTAPARISGAPALIGGSLNVTA